MDLYLFRLAAAGWQGLSEGQALQQYKDLDLYTAPFCPLRNTLSDSPLRAFIKVVVDAGTDRVVGNHMVGDHSAEIMQVDPQ